MKGKRAQLFEAKWFSFVIALLVFAVFAFLQYQTRIPEQMEDAVLDMHYRIKMGKESHSVQAGAVLTRQDMKLSKDILILGVDTKTLSEYGKWPFPRSRHADLVNAFAHLSNQANRESALFVDFFFIEPDTNPTNDALLVDAIANSKTTFLETILNAAGSASAQDSEVARQQALYDTHGRISNVKGDWKSIRVQYGIEPPLEAYARASGGYGHANYFADSDAMYRRQPMVLRSAVLQRTIRLDELSPGYSVNAAVFEHLSWEDSQGRIHDIQTPITEAYLTALRSRMEREAPLRVEDIDLDGVPEDSFHVISFYKDEFVPSITLSLALNYFHRSLQEVEVVAGSHILIPSPMVLDQASGELVPYFIQVKPDVFDADNNLVAEGERRPVPEIRIPINENGEMLINFMGPRSSPDPEGKQTFPVRSYATYASRDPGPDPASWRRTLAVTNKIIMV
ncbi:MAG TPA: CHASE2 domain-containing protein, partial [Spirochaetales bacterium]|nr:CHASE2 domain-containing protein [Spirochaetales bacterium]